ncbi:MAG: hypothetical protein ABL998_21965, partial [Planctomycetota bacterium]
MNSRLVPFALVLCVLPLAAQSRKLNLPLPEGQVSRGGVHFQLTADSRRVVYFTRQTGDAREELRSILADGSAGAQLLSAGIPREETLTGHFFLSPEGSRVVFTTWEPAALDPITTSSRVRLYSAGTDGSPRAKPLFEHVGSPGDVSFSADEQWVLYLTHDYELERFALWSIPTDGHRDPIRLVELQGSLDEPLVTVGGRLIFQEVRDGVAEFVSITLMGTDRVRLNGPFPTGRYVADFAASADGTRVVYRANPNSRQVFELFSVPVDGSAAPVLLNGPIVAGGTVGAFDLSPDSRRVAYLATQDSERVHELYSVPIDGSAAAVKLNGALGNGQGVDPGARFTPDSQRVVFRADALVRDKFQLFSAPADGSAPSILISGPSGAGGDVIGAWDVLTPQLPVAGDRIVFLGDLVTEGVEELFSAPLDGSAPRTLLSGTMVTGGDVRGDFQVSADGRTVVFSADRLSDQAFDLWS